MAYLSIIILFLTLNLFAQSPIKENQKQVLKTTITYLIDNKKYDEAYELISKNRKSFPEDNELIRLQGLVLYLNKNFKKAEGFFKEASEKTQDSEKSINLYLLAQCKIKQGDFSNAEEILQGMSNIPASSAYSKVALQSLKNRKAIPEFFPQKDYKAQNPETSKSTPAAAKNFGSLINLVVGLDTNPVFIPDYSQTKNDAKSIFTSVTSSTYLIHESKFGKFNNSLNLGYTYYVEEIAQTFNNLRVNLATMLDPSNEFFRKHKITFSNSLDQSYQANREVDYYFTSDTLGAKKDFLINQSNLFSLNLASGFRTYANKTLADAADDRSGFSYTARGIYKYSAESWAWIHSLGAYKQDTFGGKFNTITNDYGTNLQKILPYEIEGMLSFNIMRINYVNSPENRIDTMTALGAELGREIPGISGFNAKFSYSRTHNNSAIKQYTYTQDIYSIWMTYELF